MESEKKKVSINRIKLDNQLNRVLRTKGHKGSRPVCSAILRLRNCMHYAYILLSSKFHKFYKEEQSRNFELYLKTGSGTEGVKISDKLICNT